jgi:D-glycero-D-manno-heptose 1,7-bisphosphate phosphatase
LTLADCPPMTSPDPSGFFDSEGVWCQVLTAPRGQHRPALFLDRDGVLVEEVLYLHRVEDVAIIPGAAETIAAANRRDIAVVIVTNQAGIARGYYGWKEFEAVQQAIFSGLRRSGALVDAVLACPHHPHGMDPYKHPAHPARKPQPGMLLRAAELLGIALELSWTVGDKASDLLAGRAAGLRGGLLVMTGHGPEHCEAARAMRTPQFEVLLADSIQDAAELIDLLK